MLDSRFENISNLSPILFLPKIILQFFQKDFPKIPKIKNTLEIYYFVIFLLHETEKLRDNCYLRKEGRAIDTRNK